MKVSSHCQKKLESIAKMPVPQNAKQVKQFLGLVGYYRKFVPRFSDIARPLTQLTQKNEGFDWSTQFDKCFHMLKDYLQEAPILRYPDPRSRLHTVHRCFEIHICRCINTVN